MIERLERLERKNIMNNDLKYWIALSTNLNIGAKTFQKLYNRFSSMEAVWQASEKDFKQAKIEPKIVEMVKEARQKNPDQELKKVKNLKIDVITIKNERYPKLLKEIPDAPALLYLKGKFKPEDELALAVVGSRRFTPYGARAVEKIVRPLAEAGVVIVSGLALGIDALSHKATLAVKGRTIAVLGNGLDQVYPAVNTRLAEQILAQGGALISEFPLGTPSFKYNFPFRNRIIAGLALGTLVVEGGIISGSLITARCALDYNREVFALPGDIFREASEGPNNLIKMGAKAVTSVEDILSELNIEIKSAHQQAKKVIPDTREEAIILGFMKDEPVHVDKLVELSKLDIVKVNQTMMMMEMKGKIRNLGGNQYVINK